MCRRKDGRQERRAQLRRRRKLLIGRKDNGKVKEQGMPKKYRRKNKKERRKNPKIYACGIEGKKADGNLCLRKEPKNAKV